jgi:hypothetical protein
MVADGGGGQAGGAAAPAARADAAAASVPGGATGLPSGLGAPKVVKTATIALEVKKGRFSSSFSQVASIAAANGGFVSSSTSAAGTDEGQRISVGTLVVRVPADRFDETRRQLGGLGRLTSEQLKGDDMSGTLADLDARLRNLRSQEEAIRLIMAKAKTIGETVQVQEQLTAIRDQIERLASEQARLNDAVSLSTLTVSLSEPGAGFVQPKEPSPLATSFERAVNGAEAVAGGLVVSLGYLLPLALLAAFVWLATRPFSARRARVSPVEG